MHILNLYLINYINKKGHCDESWRKNKKNLIKMIHLLICFKIFMLFF